MYSKILVPYDHSNLSKKALKYAISLAEQDEKTEILVITVLRPEVTYSYRIPKDNRSPEEELKKVHREVEEELGQLANKTDVKVLKGNPPQLVVDFAADNDCDLIVMGSRGLGGIKEVFLGSVSHHVVQKARCPVLIVK